MIVEINRDIREYEPKICGPFSAKQLVCLAAGASYAFPLAFGIPARNVAVNVLVATILLAPAVLAGWVRVYGMDLLSFSCCVFRSVFVRPKERSLQTEEEQKKPAPSVPSKEYPWVG